MAAMRALARSGLIFLAIGLLIYAAAYAAAEWLLYRTGDTNAFFRIATADRSRYDWVVLGASHAMQLDFGDFNSEIERETGRRILNLASPGTGPLYNRFVFECFLNGHRADYLLYVLDSFAFYSATWNEDRFADASLLRRTPFEATVARRFVDYSLTEGVDPRAVLDYVTGFSKINNRERFQPDIWEGEAQFERRYRPSAALDRKRIEYLYPAPVDPAAFKRYLDAFAALLDFARNAGVRVVAIKTPVPSGFYESLPDEPTFDAAISDLLARRGTPYHDFSQAMDEERFYFDSDHMNREGLAAFLDRYLKAILTSDQRTE
jgi:hypothetical protein